MKIKNSYVISIFILVFTSCQWEKNHSSGSGNHYELDIRRSINQKKKDIMLTDIANEYKYIVLETNEEVLITGIHDVILNKKSIYISDRYALYQFDQDGKFIRRIGAKGRGPGEYTGRIRVAMDKLNDEILVFSRFLLNIFDMGTGNFKRSCQINLNVAEISSLSGSTVFLTYDVSLENGGSVNELYLSDNKGNFMDSIANNLRSGNRSNIASIPLIANEDNNMVYYMYTFGDTIHMLLDNFKKKPYAVLNLDNKIKREEVNITNDNIKQLPDYLWVSNILINQEFIFISILNGVTGYSWEDQKRILFNKGTRQIDQTKGFVNDIDGGLSFWPNWISENKLITSYQSFEILEHYESNKDSDSLSKEFIEMAKNLKEEDNPVLVLVE